MVRDILTACNIVFIYNGCWKSRSEELCIIAYLCGGFHDRCSLSFQYRALILYSADVMQVAKKAHIACCSYIVCTIFACCILCQAGANPLQHYSTTPSNASATSHAKAYQASVGQSHRWGSPAWRLGLPAWWCRVPAIWGVRKRRPSSQIRAGGCCASMSASQTIRLTNGQ